MIASYNVHRCRGLDGRHDPGRIAAVLTELGADVVGLQEVDSRAGLERGLDQLEWLGRATGLSCLAGPTLLRHDGHTGNGLLTRLPVRASRRVDLSIARREPRGAIDVELECGAARLRVAVTHFGLRSAERRAQCDRLLGALAPRGEDVAALVGDFNEWFAPARLLRRIHRTFGRPNAVRTWPAPLPMLALDRLWVQPERALLELRVHASRTARVASDHLPVRGVIALPGARLPKPGPSEGAFDEDPVPR